MTAINLARMLCQPTFPRCTEGPLQSNGLDDRLWPTPPICGTVAIILPLVAMRCIAAVGRRDDSFPIYCGPGEATPSATTFLRSRPVAEFFVATKRMYPKPITGHAPLHMLQPLSPREVFARTMNTSGGARRSYVFLLASLSCNYPTQRTVGSFRGTRGGATFGLPTMIGATGTQALGIPSMFFPSAVFRKVCAKPIQHVPKPCS